MIKWGHMKGGETMKNFGSKAKIHKNFALPIEIARELERASYEYKIPEITIAIAGLSLEIQRLDSIREKGEEGNE